MASGDVVFSSNNMEVVEDKSQPTWNTTKLQSSTANLTVEAYAGYQVVSETNFDATKTYSVVITEV